MQAKRTVNVNNNVASLYQAVPLTQDTGITMIGERTNANGSKAFREAMLAGLEKCLEIAKDQVRDGAHMAPVHRLCGSRWYRGHGQAGGVISNELHAANHD